MARVSLQVNGLKDMQSRLDGLANPGAIIDPAVRTWTKGVTLRKLYGEQNYAPPIAPGLWAANTTLRQKRAFFAKMRKGGWKGRTGALGAAWTVEQVALGHYRIRNTSPYANWIVGNAIGKQQTRWARQYWWRYTDKIQDEYPELLRRCDNAIITYWQRGRYGIGE